MLRLRARTEPRLKGVVAMAGFNSFLEAFRGKRLNRIRRSRRARHQHFRTLRLESLEDRRLLAVVNSLGDDVSANGICLRKAIRDATPNEVITFAPNLNGTILLTHREIAFSIPLTIDA